MLREIDIANNSFAIKKKVMQHFSDLGYSGFLVQEVFYAQDFISLKINNDRPGAHELISDMMCSELTTLLGQCVTPGGATMKHVILQVWNRQ